MKLAMYLAVKGKSVNCARFSRRQCNSRGISLPKIFVCTYRITPREQRKVPFAILNFITRKVVDKTKTK